MPLLGSGRQLAYDDGMGPSRAGDRRTKFARAHYSGRISHVGPAALDWNHNSNDRWNPFLATDHQIRRGRPTDDTTRVYSNHREKDADRVFFGQLGDLFIVPSNIHRYGEDADGNPQRRLELDIRKAHVYYTNRDHGELAHIGPSNRPPRGKIQREVVLYFHRPTMRWRWKVWIDGGGSPPPTPTPPGTPGTPTTPNPPPGPNPGNPSTPPTPGSPTQPTGGGTTPTGGGTTTGGGTSDPSAPWTPPWWWDPDNGPYGPGPPVPFPTVSGGSTFGSTGSGGAGGGTGAGGTGSPTGSPAQPGTTDAGDDDGPNGPGTGDWGPAPGTTDPPTYDMRAEGGDDAQAANWSAHSNQHPDDMYLSSRPTGYGRSILGGFQMREGFTLAPARMGRSYLGSPAPTTDPGLLKAQDTGRSFATATYAGATQITQNQSDGTDAQHMHMLQLNAQNALSDYVDTMAGIQRSHYVEAKTVTITAPATIVSVSTTYAVASGEVKVGLTPIDVANSELRATNFSGGAGAVHSFDVAITTALGANLEVDVIMVYQIARATTITPDV